MGKDFFYFRRTIVIRGLVSMTFRVTLLTVFFIFMGLTLTTDSIWMHGKRTETGAIDFMRLKPLPLIKMEYGIKTLLLSHKDNTQNQNRQIPDVTMEKCMMVILAGSAIGSLIIFFLILKNIRSSLISLTCPISQSIRCNAAGKKKTI
jgi:hypothetical protein